MARGATLLLLVVGGSTAAGAVGSLTGRGRVVQCDSLGQNPVELDMELATVVPGLTAAEDRAIETLCHDEPQKAQIKAIAEFDRAISQAVLTISRNPAFSHAESGVFLNFGNVCVRDTDSNPHSLKILARTYGRRQGGPDCLNGQGAGVADGACSSTRASMTHTFPGAGGFFDGFASEVSVLQELDGHESYLAIVPMIRDALGQFAVGGLFVQTFTLVEETNGFAVANVKYSISVSANAQLCAFGGPDEVPRLSVSDSIFTTEGDALPDADVPLRISPPSGPLTLAQGFDLVLVVDTGGATVTGVTGSLDGQDVSGPLTACLQPAGTLTGPVTGVFLHCPGLSGSLLGAGAHTLSVFVALGDGRTLTDSATWNVRQ